jgi:hypothetical protein
LIDAALAIARFERGNGQGRSESIRRVAGGAQDQDK